MSNQDTVVVRLVVDSTGSSETFSKFAADGTAAADKTTKSMATMAKTIEDVQGRADPIFKAQIAQQRAVEQATAAAANAVKYFGVSQAAAGAIVARTSAYYGEQVTRLKAAADANSTFSKATSGVSSQLIALSSGAGVVGTTLAALGPSGLAAAVGLGAAEKALSLMSDAAHDLAQKSEELRKFSEVTGLSTNQIQALRSEASKFGVTGDEVQTSIQQFTARFNELRIGQGELLTQIRRVNPALADQMAAAGNAGDALTLFGKALQDADNIFQRNALVKAATGKGGLTSAAFLSGLDVDRVTQSYVAAGKALDENLIKKLAQLDIEIAKNSAKAKQNIASIFAQDVLESELRYANAFLLLSDTMKGFSQSAGWSTFITSVMSAVPVLGPLALLVGNLSKVLPTAAPSFGDRFSAATENPLKSYTTKPDPTLDPRYTVNALREQIAAMGDAATIAQRLDLAQKQLAISGKDAGLSEKQMGSALAALNLNAVIQAESRRVSLLGEFASVAEMVRQKQNDINAELAAKSEHAEADVAQAALGSAVALAVAVLLAMKMAETTERQKSECG